MHVLGVVLMNGGLTPATDKRSKTGVALRQPAMHPGSCTDTDNCRRSMLSASRRGAPGQQAAGNRQRVLTAIGRAYCDRGCY